VLLVGRGAGADSGAHDSAETGAYSVFVNFILSALFANKVVMHAKFSHQCPSRNEH
jgi:hypothetical protein